MDYWYKQTVEKPLFPDLEWEKPERKDQAGKLLIIGGNIHGFASVAKADQITREQGIGSARILLPDALRRTLAPLWTDAIFTPSTATGSFSKDSRELFLQNALWADGMLITGDLGRNSETAVLLDELIRSTRSPLAITKDALDYYKDAPTSIFERPNAVVVASFSQLQKLLHALKYPKPLTYTMQLMQLVEAMHAITTSYPVSIVTKHNDHIVVAVGGSVSTTQTNSDEEIWRLEYATKAIVSTIHHPNKAFDALTSSVVS